MANAGMDIKTLQYVMGHSDVGVTLNVYTHASYDRAAEQMAKIIDLGEQRGKFATCSGILRLPDNAGKACVKGVGTPEKQKKSS